MATNSVDEVVTVTHFSVDEWRQVEHKITPAIPKSPNHLQNPFNPFIRENDVESTGINDEAPDNERKEWHDEPKKSTNPFIDSNPFLGSLNPFKEPNYVLDKKDVESTQESDIKIVKNEDAESSTMIVTHKVRELLSLHFFYLH